MPLSLQSKQILTRGSHSRESNSKKRFESLDLEILKKNEKPSGTTSIQSKRAANLARTTAKKSTVSTGPFGDQQQNKINQGS